MRAKTPKIYDILPPKEVSGRHAASAQTGRVLEPEGRGSSLVGGFRAKKAVAAVAGIFFVVAAIVGIIQARFLEAAITIWPVQEPWELRKEVRVRSGDPELDTEGRILPGRILRAEQDLSRSFSSTGKVTKETKAQGTIRVYNNFNQVQVLVATTRFLSADGELFRSIERVTIPPGEELDVEVEAAEPGEDYNIGPSTFSVPGLAGTARYTEVYGKSFANMEGGAGQVLPEVTAEDIERAGEELAKVLSQKGKEIILADTNNEKDVAVVEEAMRQEIKEVRILADEGANLDDFQAQGTVEGLALVFSREDLREFIKQAALEEAGPGKAINEKSIEIKLDPIKMDWEAEELTISVEAAADLYPEFDEKELKKQLLGKSSAEAESIMGKNKAFADFQINFRPIPWRSIPEDADRVKIDIRLD